MRGGAPVGVIRRRWLQRSPTNQQRERNEGASNASTLPAGSKDLVKIAFNTVDRHRLRQYGPDRVCAEWILRNGGAVRWHGTRQVLSDYSKLQVEKSTNYRKRKYLDEIDASGSTIMHYGFLHLRGVTRLRRMVIHRCVHVQDNSMPILILVRNSLRTLEISSCDKITARGIYSLGVLLNLEKLVLADLPAFVQRLPTLAILQRRLPRCSISYDGMKH